jgi:hypothetical protein
MKKNIKTYQRIGCIILCYVIGSLFIPKALAITLPTTTYSIDASAVTGSNGWYISAVPITLQVTQGTNPVQSITYWIDSGGATTINASSTTITLIAQGSHTLNFYAKDTSDNQEVTKSFSYKIDLVAPGSWNSFVVTNTGNAHTFTITDKVSDKTSGIDNLTAEFQYSVDDGSTWGYYSNLNSCSSTWNNSAWRGISVTPNTPGTTTAVTVNVPTTDYCNSNWANTKFIRIRIRDMAGLLSTKQYALMAPWMQTTGGDVHSEGMIDMTTEGTNSTTGIVSTASNTINNFSSSQGWEIYNYPNTSISSTVFLDYYNKVNNRAITMPANIPSTSGVYKTTDLVVTSSTLPSGIATIQNLSLVILVNGDLYIDTDINLHPTSSIVWMVSNDTGIKGTVTTVDSNFFTGGNFNSTYNGGSDNQLTIEGSVTAFGSITLDRSLKGTDNLNSPAEIINYNPRIFTNPLLTTYLNLSPNTVWKEVIDY